jgi:hypothetical protein
MTLYDIDRKWSDRFIPEIQQKVGPMLLVASPFEIDAKEASDLIVLKARDMRIAARVRRPGYIERYKYQFTVRSKRNNGAKTEMRKLIEGFADWMFYGHSDEEEKRLAEWMLIDLNVWRAFLLERSYKNGWRTLVADEKGNTDKATQFMAFDVRSFPSEMLIAGTIAEELRETA